MTQPARTPDDARLQAYESQVRRRLPPARIAQAAQLARTTAWRTLESGLSTGWERRLLDEVSIAIRRQMGAMPDADIMALVFIVLTEAVKSATEDLKAIMEGVKNINKHKAAIRKLLLQMADEAEGRAVRKDEP